MNSQISHSPSGNVPNNDFCNDFLRELHCIGSLPSVLQHFGELAGWRLSYHFANSVPTFLQTSCDPEKSVTLTSSAAHELPTPLPKEILEEIAEDENLWIPIEIKTEFLRNGLHRTENRDEYQNKNQSANQNEGSEPSAQGPSVCGQEKTTSDFSAQSPYSSELPGALSFLNRPIGFLHLQPKEKRETKGPKQTSATNSVPKVSFEEARNMAFSLGDMLAEMQAMRVHLWFAEMEAASSTTILNEREDFQNETFALRFRKLLEYATKVLGMDSVGIYLLENGSQSLKLRVSVGLSMDSLMNPVRVLGRAQADLHAIHDGNIFVFDSTSPAEDAKLMPENFQTGICMPLTTDRSVLGTVWFYSDGEEPVSDHLLSEAELLAEHFAIYLEREAFFRRYGRAMEYSADLETAAALQKIQAPIQLPGRRELDICGWCKSSRTVRNPIHNAGDAPSSIVDEKSVSGDFYDWFTLRSGQTLIALGDVGIPGLGGAMLAASVRSALRSHAQYEQSVSDLMRNVHHTLWLQLAADAKISLFCGLVSNDGPYLMVHFAQIGVFRALHIRQNGVFTPLPLPFTGNFLAGPSAFHCHEDVMYLNQGDSLVVFNDGLMHGSDFSDSGRAMKNSLSAAQIQSRREMERMIVNCNLGRILSDKKQPTARLFLSLARNYLQNKVLSERNVDQSVLVMRHS